ncbi:beta-ketoacyl synthase N-terminal-like domain-containing protein, partial [Amycolatopsis sp. NPDC000746]
MTDVVVTGLGAVCCQGAGVAALDRAMTAAVAAPPDTVPDKGAGLRIPLMHRAPDIAATGHDAGRAGRLAVTAAAEALADAGLTTPHDRVVTVIGTCHGEALPRECRAEGDETPAFLVASAVADWLGGYAANTSVSNACAAGGYALTLAADLIAAGEADVVLAGGADAYSRVGWACMDRMGAVDPLCCRPFDAHRRGTVLGEGAGMLVLESAQYARARGAAVHARFAGAGWSCDAGHATAPDASGEQIERAMRQALTAAPGCVIPHGTGTVLNDRVESRALRAVLGTRADDVPLYSLKALIGHTGGASAALA